MCGNIPVSKVRDQHGGHTVQHNNNTPKKVRQQITLKIPHPPSFKNLIRVHPGLRRTSDARDYQNETPNSRPDNRKIVSINPARH